MDKAKANLRSLGANGGEVHATKMSVVKQGTLRIVESAGEILIKLTKR